MLSPMQMQYIVGLCCLRHDPNAVEVIVGDMVRDAVTETDRDVDVTLRVNEGDKEAYAFKAYEVKKEARPLDVTSVEQLCSKLNDMPEITHRGIISASGFTDPAIKKARHNNVIPFILKKWDVPIGEKFTAFSGTGKPSEFFQEFTSYLLCWADHYSWFNMDDNLEKFSWDYSYKVLNHKGKIHPDFPTIKKFMEKVLMKSTEQLLSSDLAKHLANTYKTPATLLSSVDYSASDITIDLVDTDNFNAYLKVGSNIRKIKSVEISGSIRWERRIVLPEFYIIESVLDGSAFSAAAVASYGSIDGKMLAITFPTDTRELGIETFSLGEKNENIIRKMMIRQSENIKNNMSANHNAP
ncbi:Restriction endonuclease [Azospirillum oryzae]|uniref:Restriction endonuclease n=2 Tax=Azospirillum oryzae TaxID=286727 RepID=A0A1X7GNR2_9PROT|nr:Restriction endonuclease [Azospirillum oryzae]